MKRGLTFSLMFLFVLSSTFVLAADQNVTGNVTEIETNQILINEFVFDPQTNWDGAGTINQNDQWIELYNPTTESIDITGWILYLIDTNTEIQTLSGTIEPNNYLQIIDPDGTQGNDGRLELYDPNLTLIDVVTYGNYDDGDTNNNAPDSESTDTTNECVARVPNAIDTDVDSNDFTKTFCTPLYENNFTIVPITITNLQPSPACVLESDNLTISAEITGTIESVNLTLYLNEEHEIALQGNYEGNYSYTIDSSLLDGSTTISWRFHATNFLGEETLGLPETIYINSLTQLEINPENPDGDNGWYLSEPTFTLIPETGSTAYYQWDSLPNRTYANSFGLEHAPNDANITGGIQELKYWSDACSEQVHTTILRFDFKSPDIESLAPTPDSTIFNNGPITISAYLEEMYQSNSGIDLSSVTMTLDGSPVPANVEISGSIDATVSYQSTLSDGFHEVTVSAQDNAGHTTETSWNFEVVPVSAFLVQINAPNQGLYTERRVQFNITTTREAAEIGYINHNDRNPRYKRLCRNCNGYGNDRERFKSVNEGPNEIEVIATDLFDEVDNAIVSLTLDSREPRIRSVEPTRGFSSGLFEIEFDEENPEELIVHYGNAQTGFRTHNVNIASECLLDRTYSCETQVDLTDYDGQEISYYVSLADTAGNYDESRTYELSVDNSAPIINSFDYAIDGRRATFTFDITEPFFDEVVYIDTLDERGRERRLCSRLDDGICEGSVSFSQEGQHQINFTIKDEAGNEAPHSEEFFTDSKEPKIKNTEPRRGFASGDFMVTFEEANPETLTLIYGTESETRHTTLDLSTCTQDKKNTICETNVDLADFEEQEVTYWFNLTDIVGNVDESREIKLDVDTTPPRINSFNYTEDGRTIEFLINITETNFDVVEYRDRTDSNPKFRTLCNRLNDGICEKTKRFRVGPHTIDVRALDDAGNEAAVIEGLEFIAS